MDVDPERVLALWARAPEIEGEAWNRVGVESRALYIAGIIWSQDNGTEGHMPHEAMPAIYKMGRVVLAIVTAEGN